MNQVLEVDTFKLFMSPCQLKFQLLSTYLLEGTADFLFTVYVTCSLNKHLKLEAIMWERLIICNQWVYEFFNEDKISLHMPGRNQRGVLSSLSARTCLHICTCLGVPFSEEVIGKIYRFLYTGILNSHL